MVNSNVDLQLGQEIWTVEMKKNIFKYKDETGKKRQKTSYSWEPKKGLVYGLAWDTQDKLNVFLAPVYDMWGDAYYGDEDMVCASSNEDTLYREQVFLTEEECKIECIKETEKMRRRDPFTKKVFEAVQRAKEEIGDDYIFLGRYKENTPGEFYDMYLVFNKGIGILLKWGHAEDKQVEADISEMESWGPMHPAWKEALKRSDTYSDYSVFRLKVLRAAIKTGAI
jgi:hypothetical protein